MVKAERRNLEAGLVQRSSGSLSKQAQMLTVGALEHALLKEFPALDAEEWDRTGMLVGDSSQYVGGVAVALDPTVKAVYEAAALGANVLVTHHPAFLDAPEVFAPASSVALSSGALVWAAVSKGVALLSYHTALDVSVSAQRVLPGMLNLQFNNVLVSAVSSRRKGYGQVCTVKSDDAPLSLGKLASRCTAVFGRPPRVWGDLSCTVQRIVTCTGSVGNVASAALRDGLDCVVCGEIKYHEALALSQAGLAVIELGHDTSELPLVAVLAGAIEKAKVPQGCITILDQGSNWAYPEAVRV